MGSAAITVPAGSWSRARGAFGGMMNLGPRPTFDEAALALEVHLFDVDGDFYGMYVRVDFIVRLRETRKFESPQALVEQLGRDAQDARRALATAP